MHVRPMAGPSRLNVQQRENRPPLLMSGVALPDTLNWARAGGHNPR